MGSELEKTKLERGKLRLDVAMARATVEAHVMVKLQIKALFFQQPGWRSGRENHFRSKLGVFGGGIKSPGPTH